MASLAHTVRRRSAEAHEATEEMPSMLAMDEAMERWRGTPQARQGLPRPPIRAGVNISTIISLYNSSLGSVDIHDTLVMPQWRVLPEDVVR